MRLSPSRPRVTPVAVGLAAAVVMLLVQLWAGEGRAWAYPQFQFQTYNARCNVCHFSPAGGGLINGFGRDEAGDTISGRGNGGFLHGVWSPPEWLALGADLRAAGLFKKNADEPQALLFPMQADLYARAAFSGFSVNVIAGLRGVARSVEPGQGQERGVLDRVVSREHYLMYSNGEWYARAGRFHAPYGLRYQDHSSYTRRYLGQHTMEETYNASGGYVSDEYEFHVTAFAPAPVFVLSGNEDLDNAPVGNDGVGGAFYYENRNEDQTGAFGVQAKVNMADETSTYWLGGLYKRYYEDQSVMVLGQLDLGLGTFASEIDADPQLKLAAHLGMTYYLTTGVMLGAMLERYDPDVLLSKTGRDAVVLQAQYLPYAHVEVHLLGKLEFQGEDYASPAPMGLLMLHYFL
ncbi:hypothetical protein [Haliangium sp.]|uniref:hypothetical protein n=1 Tax=Haliangium sp. TaxID=2663208 RepID=UPI003D0D76FB